MRGYKTFVTRTKYPYAVDTIHNVINNKIDLHVNEEKDVKKFNFQKYTEKINKNPFDILKRVEKFYWEVQVNPINLIMQYLRLFY